MFIATYRLPLGVALSLASSSASTDIVFESGSFPGLLLAGWTAIGFILLVLIGLWHDRFADPVEHDPLRRKKLAFHRDIGGFITFGFGVLLGSAFIWVFGPMIMFSTKPWLSPFGQVFVQLVTTVAAVTAFALSALYLPTMLSRVRRTVVITFVVLVTYPQAILFGVRQFITKIRPIRHEKSAADQVTP